MEVAAPIQPGIMLTAAGNWQKDGNGSMTPGIISVITVLCMQALYIISTACRTIFIRTESWGSAGSGKHILLMAARFIHPGYIPTAAASFKENGRI